MILLHHMWSCLRYLGVHPCDRAMKKQVKASRLIGRNYSKKRAEPVSRKVDRNGARRNKSVFRLPKFAGEYC